MEAERSAPVPEPGPVERAADEAIAACGGDLRAAVQALVADNIALTKELDFAALAHSHGYSRGWFARQREARLKERRE